ncbi:MAG: hypothetical protein TREMPRED_005084 [Tremellales sp. Tagirdzhanova-0007]|nr:MAG: hypothetical protein TREMPRED_005084 [Tremellales sp. Tagirdzhanova-0007]
MVSPAAPGLFFAFAAAALLLFASITPPAWDKVNFLSATMGSTKTLFGMLGECVKGQSCTHRSVGYDLMASGSNANINSTVLHNLTYTLVLHPIAGFFALLAFLSGILGAVAASRVSTIFMSIFAFIAWVITLVVFVIDMVLWNVVKDRIDSAGGHASLGNANWFTLGALASLFFCVCTSLCGACGRFATGRMAGEKY